MTHATTVDLAVLDPLPLIRGFTSLRRLTGMYPEFHPMIARRLDDLEDLVRRQLQAAPEIHIDIIHDYVHLNGVSFSDDSVANAQVIHELTDLGIDSIHIHPGVQRDELKAVASLLWKLKEGASDESLEERLAQVKVRHVTLGRIVPVDTRWGMQHWPDAPGENLDPAYAEALARAEQTFDGVTAGRALDAVTVRDLVQLLIHEVARSHVALSQILALKSYENLTYCHSVNVAMLSLMLGRQLRLDEPTMAALVEGALLHDIGKTRIPLDIVKKPGALDRAERKLIEAHTTRGAQILAEIDGLHPLTATVALEHHRTIRGGGYPDLGEGVIPHALSQIVSVADVYEALTGARSYQDPRPPEQAILVLARRAGEALNTGLVKAFVAAVTFFPIGSLVRTSLGETGVVVRTNPRDPLHPVVTLLGTSLECPFELQDVDTSDRDESGAHRRHIVATLPPRPGLDMPALLNRGAGVDASAPRRERRARKEVVH